VWFSRLVIPATGEVDHSLKPAWAKCYKTPFQEISCEVGHLWFMLVILANQEAEIRMITV
jgi:hypothetical protein